MIIATHATLTWLKGTCILTISEKLHGGMFRVETSTRGELVDQGRRSTMVLDDCQSPQLKLKEK